MRGPQPLYDSHLCFYLHCQYNKYSTKSSHLYAFTVLLSCHVGVKIQILAQEMATSIYICKKDKGQVKALVPGRPRSKHPRVSRASKLECKRSANRKLQIIVSFIKLCSYKTVFNIKDLNILQNCNGKIHSNFLHPV